MSATEVRVRERPILFSGPMVRAILDGRKMQTRRVLTPQPEHRQGVWCWRRHVGADNWADITSQLGHACPYGAPGDRLYVREAWGYRGSQWDSRAPDIRKHWITYRADDARGEFVRPRDADDGIPRQRLPPEAEDGLAYRDALRAYWKSWRPSIHMPRWACRLVLEVVGVRVERLHEITEEDAQREGCTAGYGPRVAGNPISSMWSARERYIALWDSLNAARGFGWATNPFVWVVEFRTAGEAIP